MRNKEIKLHMGFTDENGNLVKIPENIQKHIEEREDFWIDKIKDIDSKCGIVLERLELTEKALELACEWINDIQEMDSDCPIYADCFRVEKDCDNWDCGICDCSKFAIDHFKTKAKEMMKSE